MTLTFAAEHHAVIVGAGGAIGSASCRAYARAGAYVTALDLDGGAAQRALGGIPGRSASVDVTDLEAVRRAARDTVHDRPIDSVLYAAGVAPTSDVLELDWAEYHHTMAVNLHGALYVAQAFGRVMLDARRGASFVFISSTAGKRGEPGGSAYCASKFALLGVVECLAAELGPHRIRVNALCPGDVDSPMLRGVAQAQAQREARPVAEVLSDYASSAASGRLVAVDEVAAVAVWLASDAASGVAGESVNVDGGALTG
jgi:NAD(P)-dependent dehydrogenase (short-subunit alcohol dehydrogenase family)